MKEIRPEDIWNDEKRQAVRDAIMNYKKSPCNFDHNGECLTCDCPFEFCAYDRWKNRDYTYETEEELNKIFKDYK